MGCVNPEGVALASANNASMQGVGTELGTIRAAPSISLKTSATVDFSFVH
jgi:hypothetical protein